MLCTTVSTLLVPTLKRATVCPYTFSKVAPLINVPTATCSLNPYPLIVLLFYLQIFQFQFGCNSWHCITLSWHWYAGVYICRSCWLQTHFLFLVLRHVFHLLVFGLWLVRLTWTGTPVEYGVSHHWYLLGDSHLNICHSVSDMGFAKRLETKERGWYKWAWTS